MTPTTIHRVRVGPDFRFGAGIGTKPGWDRRASPGRIIRDPSACRLIKAALPFTRVPSACRLRRGALGPKGRSPSPVGGGTNPEGGGSSPGGGGSSPGGGGPSPGGGGPSPGGDCPDLYTQIGRARGFRRRIHLHEMAGPSSSASEPTSRQRKAGDPQRSPLSPPVPLTRRETHATHTRNP